MADDFPIIPPGGGGGAPLGPGASVANTLQMILAQRRAEKQQSLINELTQQRQSAEIQHWQNEDESNRESREVLAEQRRQAIADARAKSDKATRFSDALKNFSTQTMPPVNPLTGPVDPNDSSGDMTGSSQTPVSIASQFSPEQKRAVAILQALGPDDPSAATLVNTLLSRSATPEQDYEDEMYMDDMNHKTGFVEVQDPKDPTKKIRHQVKKGTPTHHITRAAEVGSGSGKLTDFVKKGVDPKGNTVYSVPGKVDPQTKLPILYIADPNGLGAVVYNGPVLQPAGVKERKPRVDSGTGSKFSTVRGRATSSPGVFGTAASDQDKAAYTQQEANIYSKFPQHISKYVREAIKLDPKITNDQIIDAAIEHKDLKEEDREDLAELLTLVR